MNQPTGHDFTEGPSALGDRVRYVNAYEVSRHYGGPEEGGWWYDAGEVLASVPVRNAEEEAQAKARIEEIFRPVFGTKKTRHSVLGGSDLQISVDDDVARNWPSHRPTYE